MKVFKHRGISVSTNEQPKPTRHHSGPCPYNEEPQVGDHKKGKGKMK